MYTKVAGYEAWVRATMERGDRELAEFSPCTDECDAASRECRRHEDDAWLCSERLDHCLRECFGAYPSGEPLPLQGATVNRP